MKKLIFLGASCIVCLFNSCKDSTTPDNSITEKAKANYSVVIKAIETGDVSKLDSIISKDAVEHSGGDGTMEIKGIDSIKKQFTDMKKDFSSLHFDVISEAVDGDYLFALVKVSTTTAANPVHRMPANQKMETSSVDVIKMKDGMFTEHWAFNDPKDMKKMMGSMGGDKMSTKMSGTDSTK